MSGVIEWCYVLRVKGIIHEVDKEYSILFRGGMDMAVKWVI